jgi:hypothetical protein
MNILGLHFTGLSSAHNGKYEIGAHDLDLIKVVQLLHHCRPMGVCE